MSGTIFETDFRDASGVAGLEWTRAPRSVEFGVTDGKAVRVAMEAKSDFWQKTYYEPRLVNDHGHLLYMRLGTERFLMETEFTIHEHQKFDHGGLMVRLDAEHWIKTGIEVVDGLPRLSCVCTNGHSDWSTQPWSSMTLAIRVYRLGNDFVMEAQDQSSGRWDFFRICHLNVDAACELQAGVFANAPIAAGGSIVFRYLKFEHTQGYDHKAT